MNIQVIKSSIENDEILNNIASFFRNEVYLVGGAVRDYFMGNTSYDRDLIVLDEDSREFALKIADFFGGTFVPLDEINKIYRVVMPDKLNFLDITNPIENSLEKDILRRDLTINAVAVNIRTGDVFDLCGGIDDLKNGIIRGVCEDNFIDDPLRLIRIFRFYSILGFKIDCELLNFAQKYSELISKPAKERVEYELMKLFGGKYADSALLKMDECGILEILFPFVKELKQVPPNLHHHLDLFHHSIETVKQVQLLYENSLDVVKEHMDKVDFGGFSRLAHLKLSAFVHDIGKFSTWTIEEDTGRHRFIKHDDVGSKLVVPLLKSLAFSNKQIDYSKLMVKKHMYPTAVVSAPELTEKVMMRFVRKMEDNAIDNILLAQADRLSARGPEITDEIVNENISLLNNLLNFYLEAKETLKPLPKLLDGNEVMQILNLAPSPKLGEVMNALSEAQISGDVNTKEEAILYIKTLI
ncbi:CCA tRNA nucleotidyltransferase [bacterium]|nr:CCA tRNA nucleotidyltransferase [bacterium]